MASIDTLAAAIREALAQARSLTAQIATAKNLGEDLRARLTDLGAEGKTAHTSAIITGLEENQSQANSAITQLEASLAATEALRTGQSRTGGDIPQSEPTPQAPGPPSSAATFNPRKFDPSRLAGLRRYSEAGTAEGRLYNADGSPHSDRVLRARPPDSSPFPPGRVRTPYQATTPNRGHIEGEVAATMHRDQITEATLYLNAEPCDNRGQGCKENTHAFVPEGSILNIWAVNDDGSRVFKRVKGTGEAFNG
ncbi:DddA-like double-stranded DNA deaminase toxin [Glycomyces sp. NPDC049804]|uniref:DddA-like double-stranded DNA deaminase toxin n=1 Tax=Glycomyces sp. NPDC049804 TaxID=3154363 RepID=UPI00341BC65A